jgi:hypothetical protein
MVTNMPVYVKIDEYKDILDIMELIKGKVEQAKKTLGKINELKNSEDTQLEMWKDNLEDVQRKIDMIDSVLFQPESM